MRMHRAPNRSPSDEIVFLEDGRQAALPGFDPYFGFWIADLRQQGKSPQTVQGYSRSIPNCLEILHTIVGAEVTVATVDSITPASLTSMQLQMYSEGIKGNTIQVRMSALRSFGRFLIRHEFARCYGLVLSRSLEFDQLPLHTPAWEDSASLVESACRRRDGVSWREIRNRLVLRLISLHGLTISELLAINHKDLGLAAGMLNVVRSSHQRTLHLAPEVVEDFQAYLEACPFEIGHDTPLLRGDRGERISPRMVQLSIEALRNQLGLHPDVTPRTLRKGAIFGMLASGTHDYDILARIGISAQALGAILKEQPPTALEIETWIHQANSIMTSLRVKNRG